MRRALKLVDEEKQAPKNATPLKDEEVLYIKSLAKNVSLSKAKLIVAEISAYFGGRTRLTSQEREDRARTAANARWGRDDTEKKD